MPISPKNKKRRIALRNGTLGSSSTGISRTLSRNKPIVIIKKPKGGEHEIN